MDVTSDVDGASDAGAASDARGMRAAGKGATAVPRAGRAHPTGRACTPYADAGAAADPGSTSDMDIAVSAAQQGDEGAFRVVYRAVQPQLLSYVRGLVGPADAEDVASEAWLQIARDLPSFRGDGASVRGWAARIARNRALDHLRARSRRPVSGAGVDELVQLPDRADTAGEALDAVATDRALAAIAALPREQAEAVMLRVVMGLDSTAAARVLGRRAGSVRMAAHRGLRRLAEILPTDPAADSPDVPDTPAASGAPDAPRVGPPATAVPGLSVVPGSPCPVARSRAAASPSRADASGTTVPPAAAGPAAAGRVAGAAGGFGTADRGADGGRSGAERARGAAAAGAFTANGRVSGGRTGDGFGSAEHAPDAEAERDVMYVRAAVRK